MVKIYVSLHIDKLFIAFQVFMLPKKQNMRHKEIQEIIKRIENKLKT